MIQNLILLITGFIGFVTAALSLKNHKLNSALNIYIVIIIITISARFFLLGVTPFISSNSFKLNIIRYSNFSIVIIPLFYLYNKNLSNSTKTFEKKEILHLIFPICFFIFLINLKLFKIDYKGIDFVLYAVFFVYLVLYIILSYIS